MMRTKAQVLKDLLYEIDEICKANDLFYSVTGSGAVSLLDTGEFPDSLNDLTIAMTGGDIEKLAEIMNSPDDKRFEYYVNNSNAKQFAVRIYDNTTTCINMKNFRNYSNFGVFIKVLEIKKVPGKEERKKLKMLLRFCRGRGLKNYSVKNLKRVILSTILKIPEFIIGKERLRTKEYEYRKKLVSVDTWNDALQEEVIRVGNRSFREPGQYEVKNISVDGRNISVFEAFARRLGREYSIAYSEAYEILDTEKPYAEVMNSEMISSMNSIAKQMDYCIALNWDGAEARKYIKYSWNTFLTSMDYIACKKLYTYDKVSYIFRLIDEGKLEEALEELAMYRAMRAKCRKRKIPFDKFEILDERLDVFYDENGRFDNFESLLDTDDSGNEDDNDKEEGDYDRDEENDAKNE